MILYNLWKWNHPGLVFVHVCVFYSSSQTDPGWYISSVPATGALQFSRIPVWTDQLPLYINAETSQPQSRNTMWPRHRGLDSVGRVWRCVLFWCCVIHFIFNIQMEGGTGCLVVSFFPAWAEKRGYKTAKAARNDVYRAANSLLRLAIDGRLCLCLRPPGYSQSKGQSSNHFRCVHVICHLCPTFDF